MRLFNGLAATSLVLCFIAILFWIRGRSINDEIYFNLHSHLVIAGSFPNHFDLIFYRAANYQGALMKVFRHNKHVPPMPEFWAFRLNGNTFKWEIAIPWWLLLIAGSTFPALAVSRSSKRSRAICQDRCLSCGYDLHNAKPLPRMRNNSTKNENTFNLIQYRFPLL